MFFICGVKTSDFYTVSRLKNGREEGRKERRREGGRVDRRKGRKREEGRWIDGWRERRTEGGRDGWVDG